MYLISELKRYLYIFKSRLSTALLDTCTVQCHPRRGAPRMAKFFENIQTFATFWMYNKPKTHDQNIFLIKYSFNRITLWIKFSDQWSQYSFDQNSLLVKILFWLQYSFDQNALLIKILFWLQYSLDQNTPLITILFWLEYSFD